MATPHRPTSPSLSGSSESRPINVGRSKATDKPSLPARKQLLEPDVGVLGRAESGEEPHRPQTRPVHRGVRAPRIRRQSGPAQFGCGIWHTGPVRRAVGGLERDARHRLEVGRRAAASRRMPLPAVAALFEAFGPFGRIRHAPRLRGRNHRYAPSAAAIAADSCPLGYRARYAAAMAALGSTTWRATLKHLTETWPWSWCG